MADLSFGQQAQGYPGGMAPNPNATPQEQEQYRAGWMETLQRPEVKAGLLQIGLSLMADRPIQESGGGAFANALGQGAAAMGRNEAAQAATQQQAIENAQREQQLATQARSVDVTSEGQQNQADIAAASNAAALERQTLSGEQAIALKQLPPNLGDSVLKGYNARISNAWGDRTFPRGDQATPENIQAWKDQVFKEEWNIAQQAGMGAPQPNKVTTVPVPGIGPPPTPGAAGGAPSSVPSAGAGGMPSFASEALANEAGSLGQLKPGTKIIINGRPATWYGM